MAYIKQEYMIPIWAEENSTLGANAYEWAYGNGANTPIDGGVTIYVPDGFTAEVVAMSLSIGGGSATVELIHNGVLKGAAAQVVSDGLNTVAEITPLAVVNGDLINFHTVAASGTSAPCVVTAWIRMTK
jgi:hypothetical protein